MGRPVPSFHNFVGQKKVVDQLRRELAGAQELKEAFPHTLFLGPSGVGKTLLARSLAQEFGSNIVETTGTLAVPELVAKLKLLKPMDFLFFDEAHNLSGTTQESLFELIDDGKVTTDSETVEIEACTVMLATDQPGRLLNATLKRMETRVELGFYSNFELREIVDRLATDMTLLISPQGSGLIAGVSCGLPRRAWHFLKKLRRYYPDCQTRQITIEQVRRFLVDVNIDEKGLGRLERAYLTYLGEVEVAALPTLAIHLGLDDDFVRQQIEPLLLRHRLVVISPRGRSLTDAGKDWVEGCESTNSSQEADHA